MAGVLLLLMLRPVLFAVLLTVSTLLCLVLDRSVVSSAKSRSSHLLVNYHLMLMLFPNVDLFMIHSTMRRKRNPDM